MKVTWPDDMLPYPAILDPRWTTTGSMVVARQQHTATLMSTGKVLVVGGTTNGTTALRSAELYDPSSGTWAATASMPSGAARVLHTATQLNVGSEPTTSGRVLVAGGYNGGTIYNNQLYNPTAGTWRQATSLQGLGRHAHVATLLPDGEVLLSGGLNGTTTLNTAEVFDPTVPGGGCVSTVNHLPAPMKFHQAALLTTSNSQLSNKVLVFGGNNGSATEATVALYDPIANTFSALTSLSSPREGHTATVLPNGSVLVTGGKNGSAILNTTLVFDPSTGNGTWSSAGTMTTARQGHTATLLSTSIVTSGTVVVAGGNDGSATLSSAELWDGSTTWTATTALPYAVQAHTANAIGNGSVLIAGGVSGSTTVSSTALFDGSFGLGCTSNSQCVTGFCVNGVCCDTACTGTCGACNVPGHVGTCSPVNSGTICRGSAGLCDAPETCDGTSTTCPADVVVAAGTLCRASADACDAAETCTGTSAACPTDAFQPSTTVCRPAAGPCDAAESCTGTTASCPADSSLADGTTCNDGNACTQTDTCQSGTCSGSNPVTCAAQDQCHGAGTCDPGTGACSNPALADGTACNDGDACTQTDTCQSGTCSGSNPVTCVASDQCHEAGTCDPSTGACSTPALADGTACTDGNACTQTDTCQSGTCTGANPVTCAASDQCHAAGACDPGSGVCSNPVKANGTACDDGNACTLADSCQGGTCAGTSVTCTAQDQCHTSGTCDPSSGACSNPPKGDGAGCDDGNACTSGDSCQAGNCTPGAQTCASIAVFQDPFRNYSTQVITATLTFDPPTFVPGDVLNFTSQVSNTGLYYQHTDFPTVTNNGTAPFTVGSYQEWLEYLSPSTQIWIPFAKVSYDASGTAVYDPNLVQLQAGGLFGLVVPAGGSNFVFAGTSVTLPADVAALVSDPNQASAVRSVIHVDTGPGTPGATSTADVSPYFVDGVAVATSMQTNVVMFEQAGSPTVPLSGVTSIEPGATAIYAGSAVTAALPPRGETESDRDYTNRLYGLLMETHLYVTGSGATDFRIYIPGQVPLLTVQKSGPLQGNAGVVLSYTGQLQNIGNATASAIAVTDSVGGAAIPAQVTAPASMDPAASGVANVKAGSPVDQPPGPYTDQVAVTWQDRNGNTYGPFASSFTTNLAAGHPEGYLSLSDGGAPSTQTLGTPVTLTATALDQFGSPVPNLDVQFAIAGENTQTVPAVTGADGTVTFTYDGPNLGIDTVTATATINGPAVQSAPLPLTWVSSVGTPCTGRATPLDVLLVIDGSASMFTDDQITMAQAAADALITDLDFTRDQVGGVLFGGDAAVYAHLTNDGTLAAAEINQGISDYVHACDGFCFGGTNFPLGLEVALGELQSSRHRAGATPLMIFLSDGGNTGGDPTADIAAIKALGTRSVALGYGPSVNVPLMMKIASSSNDYFLAPSIRELNWAIANVVGDACRTLPPLASAGPSQTGYEVRLPGLLTLQGEAHGAGPQGNQGLTSTWTQVSGPAPATFVDPSSPTTSVLFSQPGTYVFQLETSDGFLTTASTTTVTVDPDPSIVGANLSIALASPGPLTTGTSETATATLVDGNGVPISNYTVQFTVAGANAGAVTVLTNAAGVATFTYSGANAGMDTLHATALGSTFQLDSSSVSVQWTPPAGASPIVTQGWIGSPASQSTVMGLVPITVGSGVTLASGTVSYWPAKSPDDVHVLNDNASGGPGATLATLDTTGLSNGGYVIDLQGTDSEGNAQESAVLVTVAGDYKPGRLLVEVSEFSIPVAGVPISVGRRYDSLTKDKVGDFGNGWSLTVGHPDLQVGPTHDVTITLPTGRRVTFFLTPFQYPFPFKSLYQPLYTPEAGVFGTLTSDGCPLIVPNGGQIVCFEEADAEYSPTTYKYTDPYGTVYTMGADGSLKSIQDRTNNVINFTSDGISSPVSGQTVSFTRDAQGRITKILTPDMGDFFRTRFEYDYTYDDAGNLVTAQAPPQNVYWQITQYTYDATHLLLTTTDPAGHHARTSTFDEQGRLATDTDAMGNVTSYAYDVAAHTTTTTYPDTGVLSQTFDDRGLLLSQTDQLGHTTTHEYDANRNETKRTNALNESTTYTYDANGNQTSSTNARGEIASTTYNAFSEPVTSTNPIGNTTTIGYDGNGLPTSIADSMGPLAAFTSSDHGLPLTVTDAAGNTVFLSYDAAGNLASRLDRLGRFTSYQYDQMGRKISMTDARGGTTIYTYDQDGDLLTNVDPLGFGPLRHYEANRNLGEIATTTQYVGVNVAIARGELYTYDANNHLTTILHESDLTQSQQTWDFRGNLLTRTDELGHTTSYSYDLAGQLTKTTYADGTFTTQTYDVLGRLASKKDERGHTTTYAYESGCDCSERLTSVTDPLNRTTSMTYDEMGRKTSSTDANGHQTSYVYDLRGHQIETDYADGTATHDTYDLLGRRTATTDQTGATTRYDYDAEGQLTSVTDPLNQLTTYGYDVNGNLTSVTDVNSHTTTYAYDAANRKISRTLPLGMTETFGYDSDGNQTSHTDFRGKTATYGFDSRRPGRPTAKVPDPSLGEPTVTYAYNLDNTRSSMTDASGTTTYTYDLRDRLLTKATPEGTLTYTYDASGNVASIDSSNANGTSVSYSWDAANQLVSVSDNRLAGMTTAAYTATGRAATLSQPNGVEVTYAYDALDRVTSMAWKKGAAAAFANVAYTYSPRGQRLSVADVTGRESVYGYDAASRLTSETITGDSSGTGAITYVIDAGGNRLSRTSTVPSLAGQSFSYDANDELTIDEYDLNGNTTTSGGHTFGYDFENRLISKDGGAVTLVYDGDGNRVAKKVGDITTQYLVDDLNPSGYLQVADEVSGGIVQVRYTYGTMPVSQTREAAGLTSTSFYGYDAHGNIAFLTDISGSTTDTYTYDAWGVLIGRTGASSNTRLYSGEELDPDVGLLNLRARQYDLDTGRFLTIDSAAGDLEVPVSFRAYLYANGDPVKLADPSGRSATETIQVLRFGMAVLAAATAAYGTHILAQRYFEGAPDGPPPSFGKKQPQVDCITAARLARQQCRNVGGNPIKCGAVYALAVAICVKANFVDILNTHW